MIVQPVVEPMDRFTALDRTEVLRLLLPHPHALLHRPGDAQSGHQALAAAAPDTVVGLPLPQAELLLVRGRIQEVCPPVRHSRQLLRAGGAAAGALLTPL